MKPTFRQRSVSEIWQIVMKRRWFLILPTIAVGTAVGWVVSTLPSTYKSTSLLTIKPPAISEKVVQSLSDEDLSQRLQTINQTILSRTSLEPLIFKYSLFQAERNAGMPVEAAVDRMRYNITVELEKDNTEKVIGFRIAFVNNSPETARDVTAELASKYVKEQIVESVQSAETTSEFINQQLVEAKTNLDTLEKQRLEIMMQNVETLPESAQGLIAQLEGLRKREETIAKEKETLITEKGRLNDSIRALNSQARLIDDFGGKETEDAIREATDIEKTPAYAQLIQKRAELNAKLENLKLTLREKHPEVVKAKNDIEKINDEIENLRKNTQTRVKNATATSSRKAELQKQNLMIEKQKTESQIAQIDGQLQFKDQELQQNAAQIAVLESKINTIPNVKVALEGVTAQYESAKTIYDDLLKKYNNAQGQVQREANVQGETIRVVDPANLPSKPTNASKKPMFLALGIAAGLACGIFLVSLLEIPKLFKIQSVEDMKFYAGLPFTAVVPPLLTEAEISAKERRRLLFGAAGWVVAAASIPLLIAALQMSRVFERLA